MKKLLLITLAAGAHITSASAITIIEESFNQDVADGSFSLAGKTSGTGITGNWTGDGTLKINTGSSLTYGSLATSAGHVSTNGILTAGEAYADVSSLGNGGYLADNTSLFFSVLVNMSGGGDKRGIFTLADTQGYAFARSIRTNDNTNHPNPTGIGFNFNNGNLKAAVYDPNGAFGGSARTESTGSLSLNGAGTVLIVGEILWGTTSNTLNLYNPGTDLVQGSAFATVTTPGDFDQSGYDILSLGHKTGVSYDEIRFGTTYADVTPIPEPSAALLIGGLGVMFMLRRRRS